MTNCFQENLNEQLMRKITQTKNIMLNTRNNYNVMHDHSYYKNKKKNQRSNGQTYLNHSQILNGIDEYDTIWCVIGISSDEENDIDNNMPLSEILKIEYEKDLQLEVGLYLIM